VKVRGLPHGRPWRRIPAAGPWTIFWSAACRAPCPSAA